ncbi:MAG: type VI-B CRISPR-associated RNA-guided ribonuclease Cas13b, partial [Bacteroidota bacterium]
NLLNLARHNAYLILAYLQEKHKTGKPDGVQEDRLTEATFLSFPNPKWLGSKPEAMQAALKDLLKHFPFLAAVAAEPQAPSPDGQKGEAAKTVSGEAEPGQAVAFLQAALRRLDAERNIFSHHIYERQPLEEDEKVQLEPVFEAAVKGIVQRFPWLTDENVTHLRPAPGSEDRFRYRLTKDDDHFEDNGLYFFICLFLEAGYAHRFLSNLERFKNTGTPEMRATRNCYPHFCCKLPEPRLDSGDVKLDMLNELYRCPKELWEVLSETDRERFRVDADLPEDAEPDEPPRKVEMKRNEDRFTKYFALRYFDEMSYAQAGKKERKPFFSSLRFHIHLARLRTMENPASKGNRAESREWMKELNTFGRLSDFEWQKLPDWWLNPKTNKHPDEVEKIKQDAVKKIEQFAPRYNIIGNRIGLKFTNGKDDYQYLKPLPVLLESIGNKQKGQPIQVSLAPDAILSTHELQQL